MNTGKHIRLNAIFRKETGSTVIVAADHGGIAGPLPGIIDPCLLIQDCVDGGADSVLTTRGFARAADCAWDRGTSLILRLTGGFTTLGGKFEERMISTVEAALVNGACGVAATVKFGHELEGEFIRQASFLADECERWGVPLMVEAMVAGTDRGEPKSTDIRIAARAAAEIGADIVKTYYKGDPDGFAAVVEGCPVPVVILGGRHHADVQSVFSDVFYAMQAGAKGIALGRNLWQDRSTKAMVQAMAGLVHGGWSVEQACMYIQKEN